MNKMRKIAMFTLITVMLMGNVMSVNAAWITSYPVQSRSSYSARYTRAIQVMLLNDTTTTRSQINKAGGADGVFGSGTDSAVRTFQKARGIAVDGICGYDTYSKFNARIYNNGKSGSWTYYDGKAPFDVKWCNLRKNSSDASLQCYGYNGSWYVWFPA